MPTVPHFAKDHPLLKDVPWVPASHKRGHQVRVRVPGAGIKTFDLMFGLAKTESNRLTETLFYGDTWRDPKEFTGFAPHYATSDPNEAQNAVNVLDGGASRAGAVASAYIVAWSPETVYMAYADDECALVIADWRYVIRVANIDICARPAVDVASLMARALYRLPSLRSDLYQVRIYMNPLTARLCLPDYQPDLQFQFRSIPVMVVDELKNAEPLVRRPRALAS